MMPILTAISSGDEVSTPKKSPAKSDNNAQSKFQQAFSKAVSSAKFAGTTNKSVSGSTPEKTDFLSSGKPATLPLSPVGNETVIALHPVKGKAEDETVQTSKVSEQQWQTQPIRRRPGNDDLPDAENKIGNTTDYRLPVKKKYEDDSTSASDVNAMLAALQWMHADPLHPPQNLNSGTENLNKDPGKLITADPVAPGNHRIEQTTDRARIRSGEAGAEQSDVFSQLSKIKPGQEQYVADHMIAMHADPLPSPQLQDSSRKDLNTDPGTFIIADPVAPDTIVAMHADPLPSPQLQASSQKNLNKDPGTFIIADPVAPDTIVAMHADPLQSALLQQTGRSPLNRDPGNVVTADPTAVGSDKFNQTTVRALPVSAENAARLSDALLPLSSDSGTAQLSTADRQLATAIHHHAAQKPEQAGVQFQLPHTSISQTQEQKASSAAANLMNASDPMEDKPVSGINAPKELRQQSLMPADTETFRLKTPAAASQQEPATTSMPAQLISPGFPEINPVAARVPDARTHIPVRVGNEGWDAAISNHVLRMSSTQMRTAELDLNPPELGPLKVVLDLQSENLSTTFITGSAQVQQALEASVPKLQEMMQQAGYQLQQVNVQTSFSEHQREPQQQQQQFAAAGVTARSTTTDADNTLPAEQTVSNRTQNRKPDGIDMFV